MILPDDFLFLDGPVVEGADETERALIGLSLGLRMKSDTHRVSNIISPALSKKSTRRGALESCSAGCNAIVSSFVSLWTNSDPPRWFILLVIIHSFNLKR